MVSNSASRAAGGGRPEHSPGLPEASPARVLWLPPGRTLRRATGQGQRKKRCSLWMYAGWDAANAGMTVDTTAFGRGGGVSQPYEAFLFADLGNVFGAARNVVALEVRAASSAPRFPFFLQGHERFRPGIASSGARGPTAPLGWVRAAASQSNGQSATPFKSARILAIIASAVKIRNGLDSPFFFAFSVLAVNATKRN